MRGIGVHRGAPHQTFASQTASHDNFMAMSNLMYRAGANLNTKPKIGSLDSSQRTQILRTPSSVGRSDFGGAQLTTVRAAITRVRAGGCVAPKKKGVKRS